MIEAQSGRNNRYVTYLMLGSIFDIDLLMKNLFQGGGSTKYTAIITIGI
jgi:hypothetical protein